MDGMMGMRNDGLTSLPEAILNHEGRISSAEAALREKVGHEKLNGMFNDLRRDLLAKADGTEAHTRDMIDGFESKVDARISTLQLNLTNAFQQMADTAAQKAVERQRAAEKQAREEVENKAKDAVRGVRILIFAVGPFAGGILALLGLLAVNALTGWSPF
jgi:hypothetical protein